MADWYEIEIKGHLDQDWDDWLSGLNFTYLPDGRTVLSGQISDQPALHGLLMRINQLGLALLRVERIEMEDRNDE